jgi:hypothetical protein
MLAGDTVTETAGMSVTVADADWPELTWLVAVTVRVCCSVMALGAVYNPLDVRDPRAPLASDQETPALQRDGDANCWL